MILFNKKVLFSAFIFIYSSTFVLLNAQQEAIKGITVICPPDSFIINPYLEIKNLGANWTSITPYRNTNTSTFNISEEDVFGWWGLKDENIILSIKLAKESGLKVMLKPQLYLKKSWPGVIDFNNSEEWEEWEKCYSEFIFKYLSIAIETEADIFCLGTELKMSVKKRPEFWFSLIEKIKKNYSGQLIYSANWDSFYDIPFWEQLDYIGISSYFPVRHQNQISDINKMVKNWKPIVEKLQWFAFKKSKPILFTEFGYLSVDGAGSAHWLLEDKIDMLNVNEQEQKNALEAIFTSFWNEQTWAGGFLWKWYPDKKGHEGFFEKDYSPQGKMAEQTIYKWYNKEP